jgi:glutathione S-transferase
MPLEITLPDNYGYVILGCGVLPLVTNIYLAGPVMKARERLNVPYPNLYATPGVHKHAEEFNRIQRGHQNYLESLTTFTTVSLLGGLKHPVICAAGGVFFCAGSIIYMLGYSDMSLKVETARYDKYGRLAVLKWVGYFAALGCSISLAGSAQQWW